MASASAVRSGVDETRTPELRAHRLIQCTLDQRGAFGRQETMNGQHAVDDAPEAKGPTLPQHGFAVGDAIAVKCVA